MGERICSFDGLDLRDEQLDILNAVREFVDNEIIPVAHDLEASDTYPEEIVAGLREMGLFGMRIPEEYGGLGLDLTTYALASPSSRAAGCRSPASSTAPTSWRHARGARDPGAEAALPAAMAAGDLRRLHR